MPNIWEHPSTIAAEALRHMEDSLIIAPLCTRDVTSTFTTKSEGWKKGDVISFRTHGEYEVDSFTGSITPQDISTSTRPMAIEEHFDISVVLTAREMALDLDSFSDQVLRPASYKLAETVDAYLGTKILGAAGLYVSNDLFGSAADIAQARKAAILQQLSLDRFCLLDLDTEAKLLGQKWFNQSQTRGAAGERTLRTADMGHTMGMDFFSSISFPTNALAHTAGDGTAITNNTPAGANKIGQSVLTFDAGAGTFNEGDRLLIAGVRRPVIVATTTNAGASTTVDLVDPITEIIPDNAAITVIGDGRDLTYHGAIFDNRSLAVAFPMLDLPGDKVAATVSNNGVSIRIVQGYDPYTKKTIMSLDLLIGAFMLDPRRVTLLAESA